MRFRGKVVALITRYLKSKISIDHRLVLMSVLPARCVNGNNIDIKEGEEVHLRCLAEGIQSVLKFPNVPNVLVVRGC